MKKYRLVIAYDKRVITITFASIKDLDTFTETYEDSKELGDMINKILDLKIDGASVNKMYIAKVQTKETKEGIREYQDYYPVKYLGDNFNLEDVRNKYIKYFMDDVNRLKKPPVGLDKLIFNYQKKHNNSNMGVNDINYVISLYLDNNYERYRNAYFTLKNNGYRVKINNQKFESNKKDKTDLSKYEPSDTFSNYLSRYASLGEEEHAKAMDILSGYQEDEIKAMFKNDEYDLFDGITLKGHDGKSVKDERDSLFALANMSVSELTELVDNYRSRYNKGHKR